MKSLLTESRHISSLISIMEDFKLIQCYRCWELTSHIRPNCPYLHEPKICPRCGDNDHDYAHCYHVPRCLNCNGQHPATARCCPVYKIKFQESLQKLLIQNTDSPTSHTTTIDTRSSPYPTESTVTNVDVQHILQAAVMQAKDATEFLTAIFKVCQIFNTDRQPCPPWFPQVPSLVAGPFVYIYIYIYTIIFYIYVYIYRYNVMMSMLSHI